MIWILLVIFQFKHFIADYPLQNEYMLGKFKKEGWKLPLASHCAVHFCFTFVISFVTLLACGNRFIVSLLFSLLFGLVDFNIHFIMDRIKASPDLLGRFKALSQREYLALQKEESELRHIKETIESHLAFDLANYNIKAKKLKRDNVLFWWSLGIDQMVHHLTDILIIALIVWVA